MTTRLRRGFVLILLYCCLLLQGCWVAEPAAEIRYPYCRNTSDLIRPDISSPADHTVSDDLSPAFSWHYWRECRPLNYHIQVAESPHCQDGSDAAWTEDESAILIDEMVGSDLEWSPVDGLEPLTNYQWRVAGIINGTLGEYSLPACFWTGPVCASDSLVAPTLLGLSDGSVISTEFALFAWDYPDSCFPHVLQAELSDNPSFSGGNLIWELGETDIDLFFTSVSMATLVDCTTYYWRVTARVASTWGPPSTVWTFSTDFDGTCGEPDPTVTTGPPPIDAPLPTNTLPAPTPADQVPPPAPAPISPIGDITCTPMVDLKWDPVNDPGGISEYRVTLAHYNQQNEYQSIFTDVGTQQTWMSVQVDCGWYYRWKVVAVDGAGNVGPSSSWIEFKVLGQNFARWIMP